MRHFIIVKSIIGLSIEGGNARNVKKGFGVHRQL